MNAQAKVMNEQAAVMNEQAGAMNEQAKVMIRELGELVKLLAPLSDAKTASRASSSCSATATHPPAETSRDRSAVGDRHGHQRPATTSLWPSISAIVEVKRVA